ncbi:MAG: hypothetical protein MUO18_07955, partial [Methanomassiliicoccales archaeon]|nr:hypothetical protein [Methanomassiliicoccales archaeon]
MFKEEDSVDNGMKPRDRVLAALACKKLDRPPVVCFTQSATVDQMDAVGVHWPDAHTDPDKMATLALASNKVFGFESARLPFCLTVEAEIMGCTVDLGKIDRTPMVKKHVFESSSEVDVPKDLSQLGRAKIVVEATKLLKKRSGGELPVVVGTTGPFTIAGHLVGTENLLLWIVTEPESVHKFVKIAAQIEQPVTQQRFVEHTIRRRSICGRSQTARCRQASPPVFRHASQTDRQYPGHHIVVMP